MKTYLVLDLGAILGIARTVVRDAVHKHLMELGFTWLDPNIEQNAQAADFWVIGSFEKREEFNRLSFAQDYRTVDFWVKQQQGRGKEAKVYSAVTDLDAFIADAAQYFNQMRFIHETIDGVDVTITREGVVLDISKLTASVEEKAHARRKEEFLQ
jgi:hypothetical protein